MTPIPAASVTTHICIVYHSDSGHTARLARAVAEGAERVPGVQARLIRVEDVDGHWDALHAAGAIVFGSPTYIGGVSAVFKTFVEKLAGDVWRRRLWTGKVAGGFTVAAGLSGDKLAALMQMVISASQMGMVWVSVPVLNSRHAGEAQDLHVNRMSGYLGAMAQTPRDGGGPDEIPAGDLMTGTLHGEHIATIAVRLAAGRRVLAPTD